MESKEFKIQKKRFKSCIKMLLDFDKLIKKYYLECQDKSPIKDFGYLVDKNCFEDLKDKLSYSEIKIYINDDSKFNTKMAEKYGNDNDITYIPLEQKLFKTSQELIKSFSKINEYIIINLSLWKRFNNGKFKENEGKINYEINEKFLVINLDNGEKLNFSHNFNIIKSDNLKGKTGNNMLINPENENYEDKKKKDSPTQIIGNDINSDENSITDLYSSMIEYYNYEQLLLKKLIENNNDNISIIMEG